MRNTILNVLQSCILGASLAMVPAVVFAEGADARAHVGADSGSCTMSAFGHLVAPGWIAQHGTTTLDAACRVPAGIAKKLDVSGSVANSRGSTNGRFIISVK